MKETLERNTNIYGYRIVCKIELDGMGEVFPAQDTTLDSRVAIKFLGLTRTVMRVK